MRSGVDTDGDGVLGDDELRDTQYVCKESTSGGEDPEPESGAEKTPPTTTDTGSDRPVVPSPIGPLWQENTWDAMAELGGGVDLEDKGRFFGRIRGGLLWVREPFFISLAAMAEVGPYAPVAAGIQGEVAWQRETAISPS